MHFLGVKEIPRDLGEPSTPQQVVPIAIDEIPTALLESFYSATSFLETSAQFYEALCKSEVACALHAAAAAAVAAEAAVWIHRGQEANREKNPHKIRHLTFSYKSMHRKNVSNVHYG